MKAAFGGILALALAVRLGCFSGLQVGDDIVYSTIAVERLDGKWTVGNVQETRQAFLLPILASYAAFGPGEASLVLYNLLCSLGAVALAFVIARKHFGPWGAVWTALLAALHPNLVFFATECHADSPLAFWTLASLALLFRAESSARPARDMAICGLLLGWGYLHKTSAVFVLPFFLAHWISGRRSWKLYAPAAAAFVAVLVAEAAMYGAWTGDPIRRISMIRYWHVQQYMTEAHPSVGAVLDRVFLDLPRKLFGLRGIVNLAALAAFVACRDARRFAGWFASVYVCYCAWPSSLVPYLPAFNLYEWTFPPLVLPLAFVLGGALGRMRPARASILAAALAAVCIGGIVEHHAATRRLTAGPREAYAWIAEHNPPVVISDDRSTQVFEFMEGHRPKRRYVPFQDRADETGVVIVDLFWTEPGQWWSRPGIAVDPAWEKLHESERVAIYRSR